LEESGLIHLVPPGAILEELWPHVAPLLARALRQHDFLDTDGLRLLLKAQRADLAIVAADGELAGALVMEVVQYPGVRVGNILALAGRDGFYRDHLDDAVAWAKAWCRERACPIIGFAGGRPGWLRYVGKRGWVTRRFLTAWTSSHADAIQNSARVHGPEHADAAWREHAESGPSDGADQPGDDGRPELRRAAG
jgi:hypothetical protein